MKKLFLIGLIIFSSTIAYAQCQSAASTGIPWLRCDFFSHTGGLNDAFSPINVEDDEASDLRNVVFTTSGNFKTRDGFARVNSTAINADLAFTGLTYYKQADGDEFLVAATDNDRLYKMDFDSTGPDGTWDDITGSITFDTTTNTLSSFTIGEDVLIIEDGTNTNAPVKWTGSGDAAALGGTPPNCSMVAYHKGHAFCAGNNTNASTLYFSDKDDIENWTTGLSGNLTIETNDGSVIRAIEPGFDALYVWKDNDIWRVSGDDKDTFELQRMVKDIGCLSSQCVSLIGNDFIFMDSKADVYIYDGGVKIRLISSKIEGTTGNLNFSRLNNVITEVFDNDFYLVVSDTGVSTNDIVLIFDTFHFAWTRFAGLNINAMSAGDNGSGKDILYFGDYAGFANEYPSGTNDAGTAINMFYNTKQYRFPEINIFKTFKVINVYVDQQGDYNISVELRSDFGSAGTTQTINLSASSSTYGSAIYGTDIYGGQNLIIGRLEFDLEGQFFQLRYSNSNLDEPVEVKGWSAFIEELDRI